jgi:branched-subunit amino acid aminotransferase/4-amino-4-deoxychorismate lyase
LTNEYQNTRDLALESALACHLKIKESGFTTDRLLSADEVWISSSTREIMCLPRAK